VKAGFEGGEEEGGRRDGARRRDLSNSAGVVNRTRVFPSASAAPTTA
jgi:hypothetical protein